MVYYTPATSHRAVRMAPRAQLCAAGWATGRARGARPTDTWTCRLGTCGGHTQTWPAHRHEGVCATHTGTRTHGPVAPPPRSSPPLPVSPPSLQLPPWWWTPAPSSVPAGAGAFLRGLGGDGQVGGGGELHPLPWGGNCPLSVSETQFSARAGTAALTGAGSRHTTALVLS